MSTSKNGSKLSLKVFRVPIPVWFHDNQVTTLMGSFQMIIFFQYSMIKYVLTIIIKTVLKTCHIMNIIRAMTSSKCSSGMSAISQN